MVTTRRPQMVEVDDNFFAYRQRDLERKSRQAHIARARKARIEARKPVKRNREAERLLARYKSWHVPQKLQFAVNGYSFNRRGDKPAIEICKTTIKTVRNMSSGI